MGLPTDKDARNSLPIWDGCIAYWPDVWAEIAKVSVLGNKQHSLGAKLHWDTHVSTDHANKVMRHMLDDAAGNVYDDDGETMHLAKAMWRIGAMLQLRCWARDGKDAHGVPIVAQASRAVNDTDHAICPHGYAVTDERGYTRPWRDDRGVLHGLYGCK